MRGRRRAGISSLETLVIIDMLYSSARTVVIALTISICTVFTFLAIGDDIEDLIANRLTQVPFDLVTHLQKPQFWDLAARGISKLAQANLDFPQEQRAKVISDLASMGDRWGPYLAAITGDKRACDPGGTRLDTTPR